MRNLQQLSSNQIYFELETAQGNFICVTLHLGTKHRLISYSFVDSSEQRRKVKATPHEFLMIFAELQKCNVDFDTLTMVELIGLEEKG